MPYPYYYASLERLCFAAYALVIRMFNNNVTCGDAVGKSFGANVESCFSNGALT
jgi:hypothetical protein